MVFNTISVGAAITPAVIETAFSHYLNRKPLHHKPTAHISYHEGLGLVRQFLAYASNHTVDDVQAFTAQWVPNPRWVKVDEITIREALLDRAAHLIRTQLGHKGIDKIGGQAWWQWRQEDAPLKAEWIEMRTDFQERKLVGDDVGQRILLYVHGGAYYFGSVDEHRYQMQRHARKLKARVLAPRYRLAPQFPFPCGLYDCIAAYLYLLEQHHPSTILLAGDSAGGGMVLSMLVTLRDQGIALPAGAILLSPWVDLTHSFPSVAGDGSFDYIPAHGFLHRPSLSWPPPNSMDMKNIAKSAVQALVDAEKKGLHAHGKEKVKKQSEHEKKEELEEQEALQGFIVDEDPGNRDEVHNEDNPASPRDPNPRGGDTIPGPGHDLSIILDGKLVEIIDQIQMYTTNQLLAHPLVSPVLQPSLGGLPPLFIQTGGGELLRDEQIYIAHKAANPAAYAPSNLFLDEHDPHREILQKYPPTDVQVQVWEDLCHVPHTLSFTRPAKYMYRGVAQFGAWAYSRAQKKTNEALDDDAISIISGTSDGSRKELDNDVKPGSNAAQTPHADGTQRDTAMPPPLGSVGQAGDPLPPFKNHMIRQRVTRHGVIYALAPVADIPALHMEAAQIGVIKAGPVRKWLAKKAEWDHKFAREKRSVQKQRTKEMTQGYDVIGDEETPPPTALAGRRRKDMPGVKRRKGKSWGLAMWSGWGSKHDESTIEKKEEMAGGERRRSSTAGLRKGSSSSAKTAGAESEKTRGKEARRENGTSGEQTTRGLRRTDEEAAAGLAATAAAVPIATSEAKVHGASGDDLTSVGDTSTKIPSHEERLDTVPALSGANTADKVVGSENTFLSPLSSRPHNGTVAYPFKLRNEGLDRSSSTFTLDGFDHDLVPPMGGGLDGLAEDASEADPGVGETQGNMITGEAVEDSAAAPARPPLESFITAREF